MEYSKSMIPTECPAEGALKVIAIFPGTDGNFVQSLHFSLSEVTFGCGHI